VQPNFPVLAPCVHTYVGAHSFVYC